MTVGTFDPKTDPTPNVANAALSTPISQPLTDTPTKKVFIATQGCQMNVYDSEKMADVLGDSHGMVLTDNPEEADVLLMNTCSIR
ncbi:MAG: tRNA (N6-isopentenyl adenosine(37)-C2)-methylthiotransferase MiaB, partial [Moraxella sp.]